MTFKVRTFEASGILRPARAWAALHAESEQRPDSSCGRPPGEIDAIERGRMAQSKQSPSRRRRGRGAARGPQQLRLRPIGVIRSALKDRRAAPLQGWEGAPDAWLDVEPWSREALRGVAAGDEILVITWLHEARRDVLLVHPRGDDRLPLTGIFATRSPDRPNPLGLHPVTVRRRVGHRLRIGPIEAIDGTPVVDVKPVI